MAEIKDGGRGDLTMARYPHLTASEVLDGADLTGRTAVVTGGGSGLGLETARALVTAGATVLITSRDARKGDAIAARLRQEAGCGDVQSAVLDLMSLASIDAFIAVTLEHFPRLDMLILNAGLMTATLERNEQGIESQFMSNFIGHQLIAAGLAPSLIAAAPSRIVVLSSCAHNASPVVFEDPNFERREYHPYLAYGQSKTADALLAIELNRRLKDKGVLAFSVHPGSIFETNLATNSGLVDPNASTDDMFKATGMDAKDRKTLQEGAATSVWAATDVGLADTGGGLYLEDTDIAPHDDPYPFRGVEAYARDPQAARQVWDLGARLVGRDPERLSPGAA